jgi:hypothetical protein
MDQLWRQVKRQTLASWPTQTIDRSADDACQLILGMSRRERLRKAARPEQRQRKSGRPPFRLASLPISKCLSGWSGSK